MKIFSCKITGHNLNELTNNALYVKEYECAKCKQQFTTDGYGRLVKLTRYWKENNKYFATFIKS
ncbi:hypothetical protein [Marinirhabdus gelatinilytica]|uniref:Prophage protein DUF1660 n=1 Tax=Marinirhabdus gelatinilytica TaxID=1703343 RepID=A0A370QIN2_9FLAO|nr:hypothetical protein [Marinirhabdus gelatinilytica]RDK88218.1 hypothetical protein C8D94_10187 [Marinirhabdus gelatinilytica]